MEMWKCHTTARSLPVPDEDSQIFWEGCRRRRLLIQQCSACGAFRFPPSPLCQACLGTLAMWREDPGTGSVGTFCVYYDTLAGPAWATVLPYVVAVVHLDYSQVYMVSRLQCADPQQVTIGQRVALDFEVIQDTIFLPLFYVV